MARSKGRENGHHERLSCGVDSCKHEIHAANKPSRSPSSRTDVSISSIRCATLVQRGYWEEKKKPRATQLHLFTSEARRNIPTENMEAERYLSCFGHLASVSACNKFFKAKRIRDGMMFTSTADDIQNATETTSRRVIKTLN